MDYLLKIENISLLLDKSGYPDLAQKIKQLGDGASVGSELLMSVTHELLQIIGVSVTIESLIGNDVLELRDYCWSIGLMVK
jgi:hypothetical protein